MKHSKSNVEFSDFSVIHQHFNALHFIIKPYFVLHFLRGVSRSPGMRLTAQRSSTVLRLVRAAVRPPIAWRHRSNRILPNRWLATLPFRQTTSGQIGQSR
jgi:hypothetical protein